MTEDYEQSPTQDALAEQSVLGAMMSDPSVIGDVMEILQGPDFYRPNHETIYLAIAALYTEGEPVDMVTVGARLARDGMLARIGGASYLHDMVAATPITINADHWARAVVEAAQFRALETLGQRLVQRGRAAQGEAREAWDGALSLVMRANDRGDRQDYEPMERLLPATLEALEAQAAGSEQASNISCGAGYADLDEVLGGGFRFGQMIVVAGRPSAGKSTVAVDFARHAAVHQGHGAAVFSLEMDRVELTQRMLSAESRVALQKIRSGLLSEDDWDRIARATTPLLNAPLWVDDSSNLTMAEIQAKARRLKAQHDVRLIVIDYLQLMSSGSRVESRQLEVSEFSRQAKLLAKNVGLTVVLLSQLNRKVEERQNKRPIMSDLRESGSIESDADVILMLHREDMYDRESQRPGEADLLVVKHRGGPTRDITLAAQLHMSRFADMFRA